MNPQQDRGLARPQHRTAISSVPPLAHLNRIELYVPGQSPEVDALRLASNENPYGCSPKVIEALRTIQPAIYPDGSATALRQTLALHHRLDPDRIVCGVGSDQIIHMLARAYLDQNSGIVVTDPSFPMYALAARQSGARVDTAIGDDVDALLNAVKPHTRMVCIANPNNPTGRALTAADIERLHLGLATDVMLVIDAAYAEYTDDPEYRDGLDLACGAHNVVALRTFSKIYGLASLRLGWAYAACDVISVLNRVRDPFNLSSAAIAGGMAALSDGQFVQDCTERNRRLRTHLTDGLIANGLEVMPSQANFVLARFASPQAARDADAALLAGGIRVRNAQDYGLPDCLRITVGDHNAVDAVLDVLGAFLSG